MQDRHFKGSKRLRNTAPVYPIPPLGRRVEHFGGERRRHAGMLFQRQSANAFQKDQQEDLIVGLWRGITGERDGRVWYRM